MTTRRIGSLAWQLLLIGLVIVVPCVAHAGLTGDTVTSSLNDDETATDIFSGSAIVSAALEFSGVFAPPPDTSTWTLDLTDTGFTLTGVCADPGVGCDFDLLTLSISDLDFTPPANLVGLSGIGGLLTDFAGVPLITSSSVVIEFTDVQLGSGNPTTQTYSATFATETPVAGVPLPGALVLLAVGGAVSFYGLRVRRPRI